MMHSMRSCIQAVASEATEFNEEVRQIFRELGRMGGAEALTGECSPPVDVFETDDAVEIAMDLPGVDPRAVRIVAKSQTILIAGDKAPRRTRGDSSFHLVERGYGRFARAVRLSAPCDASRARAAFTNGELRVTLPKGVDRRGRPIRIPLTAEPPVA